MSRVCIEQAAQLPEPIDLEDLDFLLDRVLEDHDAVGTVTLILADDVTLGRLNREFKGASGATDVLSFDLADPVHPDGGDFGEIYISVDRAESQARETTRGLSDEISRLAIHGILHLLGYRHGEPGAGASMRRKEREYMARLQAGKTLKGV